MSHILLWGLPFCRWAYINLLKCSFWWINFSNIPLRYFSIFLRTRTIVSSVFHSYMHSNQININAFCSWIFHTSRRSSLKQMLAVEQMSWNDLMFDNRAFFSLLICSHLMLWIGQNGLIMNTTETQWNRKLGCLVQLLYLFPMLFDSWNNRICRNMQLIVWWFKLFFAKR